MSFDVSVVEFPAKRLVGMKVRTNMQNAHKDCSALWQTFGPRSGELTQGKCADQPGYGASIMVNEEDFDYWAANEVIDEATMPNDMGTFDIPAGLYAKVRVDSLAQMGEAYGYIYCQWIEGQSEYALDMQGIGFELYPPHWDTQSSLDIYVAVTKR